MPASVLAAWSQGFTKLIGHFMRDSSDTCVSRKRHYVPGVEIIVHKTHAFRLPSASSSVLLA